MYLYVSSVNLLYQGPEVFQIFGAFPFTYEFGVTTTRPSDNSSKTNYNRLFRSITLITTQSYTMQKRDLFNSLKFPANLAGTQDVIIQSKRAGNM